MRPATPPGGAGDPADEHAADAAAGAPGPDPVSAAQGRSGLAAALGPDFSVSQALGGPRGVAEAALPSLVFVVVVSLAQDLRTAVYSALGAAALFAVLRLITRSSPSQALSGLLGVAVCALIASRTGEARDFFAMGLLVNVVYAAVYVVSTLRTPAFSLPRGGGRRVRVPQGPWPVLGLVLGLLTEERLAWKDDARRLRVYVQVTWVWVAVFVLRLLVQGPLYLADQVAALGTARLVMGFPLFGAAAYLTWVLVRRVPLAQHHDDGRTAPGATADPERLES